MADETDEQLLVRCRTGDRSAYAVLYERHVAGAQRFATTLVGDPVQASDLVSEAFIKVMGVLDNGRGPESNFSGYLITTIRNVRYDDLRRYRREDLRDDMASVRGADATVQDHAALHAESEVVNRAFSGLPERWREVLWYTEVLKEPLETVAARLGMKRNAVGVLSWRAREGFRQGYLAAHLAVSDDPACTKYAPHIPQYIRNQPTPARVEGLDAHLATCEACPRAVADLAAINTNLGAFLAPVTLVLGATSKHAEAVVVRAAAHPLRSKLVAALVAAAGTTAVIAGVRASGPPPADPAVTASEGPVATPAPARRARTPPTPAAPARATPTRSTAQPSGRPSAVRPPSAPAKVEASPQAPAATTRPAAPALGLLTPQVTTSRTSQTTNVRVASVASHGSGPLTLTITLTNAAGFTLLDDDGSWTCRSTPAPPSSLRFVCSFAGDRASTETPVRFGVSASEVTQPLTGTLTLQDSRTRVDRRLDVAAGP